MICPNCGNSSADGLAFCPSCSHRLPKRLDQSNPKASAETQITRLGTVPNSGGSAETTVGVGGTSISSTTRTLEVAGSVGDMIGKRYKLETMLGRGGMGVVYKARDLDLGEEIALKLLQPAATRDPQEIERFKREIITARKITHPNVIRIHDFGMAGEDSFISMELLAGGTLTQRIEAGNIPLEEAADIAIGICDGLQAAHDEGIIHRDLKPDNVLFDLAGRPKLVDFGLARLAAATTRTIGFSGTPFYMSPEQADGRDATQRSDVYSLGVMLYELFTGRLPFVADSLVRLAVMHAQQQPPDPRSVRPDLPAEIQAILLRALEKDPESRYARPVELAEDLLAWREGRPLVHAMSVPSMPAAATISGLHRRPGAAGATSRRSTGERPAVTPSSPESAPTAVPAKDPTLILSLRAADLERKSKSQPVVQLGEGEGRARSRAMIFFGLAGLVVAVALGVIFAPKIFRGAGAKETPTPVAVAATPTPTQTSMMPTVTPGVAATPRPAVTHAAPTPTRIAIALPTPTAHIASTPPPRTPVPTPTPRAAPATVSVHIYGKPWAEVTIDGKFRGRNEPPNNKFDITPGRHEIILSNPNVANGVIRKTYTIQGGPKNAMDLHYDLTTRTSETMPE